jgi:spermidine synthase
VINDFFPADPDAVQPVVHQDERTLSMVFDMSSVQSRMRRADPVALELDYTRTMMGFLLVEPDPAAILMIGLGGGSLVKYCHKHLPLADITVVEINPHVIALRDAFFVPRDDDAFASCSATARRMSRAPRAAMTCCSSTASTSTASPTRCARPPSIAPAAPRSASVACWSSTCMPRSRPAPN